MKVYSLAQDYQHLSKFRCPDPLMWRSHRLRRRRWGCRAKELLHRNLRREKRREIRSLYHGGTCEPEVSPTGVAFSRCSYQ